MDDGMSVKQILFNTEMVRAILDGRKTVTRRVVKDYDKYERLLGIELIFSMQVYKAFNSPCEPGDILWVRETWKVQAAHRFESDVRIMFKAGGPLSTIQFPGRNSQATSRDDYDAFTDKWMQGDGWRPSIHMPREAARIWLRVTDVRVERLQEINMFGILHEGVVPVSIKGGDWKQWQNDYMKPAWDSTIKPADRDRYGWAANPWVWVIAFERCEKPEEG